MKLFTSFWISFFICFASIVCQQTVTIETSNDTFPMELFEDSHSYLDYETCGNYQNPDQWKEDYMKFCFRHRYQQESQDRATARLFAGGSTTINEAPWVVFVQPTQFHGTFKLRCTGVLIGYQWIVTAAHCYDIQWRHQYHQELMVYAGSNIELEGADRQAYKWIRHPKFVSGYSTREHDIALIKIDPPFDKNDPNINTICLPKKYYINKKPMKATSFGYGYHKGKIESKLLLKADLEIDSHFNCRPNMICRNKFTEGSGQLWAGDSGGPLVQYVNTKRGRKTMLIGIVQGANVSKRYKKCDYKPWSQWWASIPFLMEWIEITDGLNR